MAVLYRGTPGSGPSVWHRGHARSMLSLANMGSGQCGTNFDTVLQQAGSTTGRTFLDLVLTDWANRLADSRFPAEQPDQGDDLDGDDSDAPPPPPPPDGPSLGDLTGDPDAGDGIFASSNCAACHCADAGGGCALGAPAVIGLPAEKLDDVLRGDAPHPGGKLADLTNQEVADLEAWLAALDIG